MTEKCHETFRVAVYGTLLSGERNEHWAAGALSRVPCVIRGVLYNTGWGFPAFVPDADGQKVRAELLTVDTEGLARMYMLEGCPNFYRREEVVVALADGTAVSAMVYVMTRLPPRAAVIASGDWRNR